MILRQRATITIGPPEWPTFPWDDEDEDDDEEYITDEDLEIEI